MKIPDCYDQFDPSEMPVMLRVEAGEKWGFLSLKFSMSINKGDELAISFATHDLTIRGNSLELLHKEICRSRVAVIRVGESNDGVTIAAIEVEEVGA